MGMAASQARLLSITARLTNNENTGQNISYAKQRLADQTQQITNEYNEALDTTKLTVLTGFNGADANYMDISYNLMTGLQMAESMKQYVVTDTKGKILVTEGIANAYQQSRGNYNVFLAKLGYSQADINVQKTYTNAADKTTQQADAETKIHEAWDKYFETVGIQVGDPEHAVPPQFIWVETKHPQDGSYNIGDGYVGYRGIDGYEDLVIDGQTVYETGLQPKTDADGNIVHEKKKTVEDVGNKDNLGCVWPQKGDGTYKQETLSIGGKQIFVCKTDESGKYDPLKFEEGSELSTAPTYNPKEIYNQLGGVLIRKKDPNASLQTASKNTANQSWGIQEGELANIAPYYSNYYEVIVLPDPSPNGEDDIDAINELTRILADLREFRENGDPEDDPAGRPMFYMPKMTNENVYINGAENTVDDKSKEPLEWGTKEVWDEDSPIVYESVPTNVPKKDYTKPIYSDKISPINYEGATQESREYFDYAMSITEAYLRTNAGGADFHKEYDMTAMNSAFNTDNSSALKYYKNIFNKIQSSGYFTYTNTPADAARDPEHYIYANVGTGTAGNVQKSPLYDNVTFEAALRDGSLRLEYYSSTDKAFKSTTISEDNCIQEVKDERAIAKAESKYTQDMADLENQDNKLDLELKKLDTEHNALQTEYDSVKNVISKNVESSFKIFS